MNGLDFTPNRGENDRVGAQIAHNCRTLQMVIDDLMQAWNCCPIGHSHVAASRSQIEFAFMSLAALRASINQASTSPEKLEAAE